MVNLGLIGFGVYKNDEIRLWFGRFYVYSKKSPPVSLDQIYVINLDRSKDRYAVMQETLARHGVNNYHRFSAADGYNLKFVSEDNEIFSGMDVKTGKFTLLNGNKLYKVLCLDKDVTYVHGFLGLGEIGCYCSHLQVWQEVVTKKQKYAMVLEDDAVLFTNFNEDMDNVLKNLPSKWDITYIDILGYREKSRTSFNRIINNPYLRKIPSTTKGVYGTGAYMVSYDGAKKLLDAAKGMIDMAIDGKLSDLIKRKEIRAYKTTKSFIKQKSWREPGIHNPDSVIGAM